MMESTSPHDLRMTKSTSPLESFMQETQSILRVSVHPPSNLPQNSSNKLDTSSLAL